MTITALRRAGARALVLCGLCSGLAAQTPEEPVDADVLKRLSLEELMALEVTSASRTPVPFGQVAAALQVVTNDQIRRSGATTLAEALRLATNLAVAQKNAGAWAVSARGFNTDLANKLLVLIDGRTVYTPLFSGVFWERQDYVLEDVDRIEVIAGPGGALWGANAVNGVINIITKSAAETEGLYATAGAGTQLKTIASARWGGTAGSALRYRLYGKYVDRDGEVRPDGSDAADDWSRLQGGFRADAELSGRDALTVQGDVYEGEQDAVAGRTGESGGGNLLARWTRSFSDESGLALQLYFDRTHLMLPTPPSTNGEGLVFAPAGTLEDDLDTWDLDVQHNFAVGRNRIVWGFGYRRTHNEVGNAPGLAFDPPVLDRDLFSVFAQDEVALGSDLALILGTKVEHNDYTGVELEPNARLRWSPAGAHLLWGAVSRAVRMPSRVDTHERLPTPALSPLVDNLLVANEDFVSETLIAYELGYRAELGSVVGASVATFYNVYDDLRSTSLSPPDPVTTLPFPLFFENDLEATTYGAEVVLNVRPTSTFGVKLGYTWLHADVEIREGGTDTNNALNETADPEQQLFVQAALDLPAGLEADAALRWIDRFTYSFAGQARTVPDYAEVDARLAWRPTPRFELAVMGRNLLHDQHLEYVISAPNPRAEIERTVEGRVTVRW